LYEQVERDKNVCFEGLQRIKTNSGREETKVKQAPYLQKETV
jgi:hypothetical protein